MNKHLFPGKPWRSSCATLVVALMLTLSAALSWARIAPPLVGDPALELRMMTLAAGLRCLVCQNQSLADSNAELAVDLRNEMRKQLKQGASDQDIINYMVARYGDFVLYRPPLKASTVLLWSGPLLLLLIGLGLQWRTLKRRRTDDAAPAANDSAHLRTGETS